MAALVSLNLHKNDLEEERLTLYPSQLFIKLHFFDFGIRNFMFLTPTTEKSQNNKLTPACDLTLHSKNPKNSYDNYHALHKLTLVVHVVLNVLHA